MPKKVPYLTSSGSSATLRRYWPNTSKLVASSSTRQVPIEDIVEKHLKLGIEFDDMHRLLDHRRSGLGRDPDILGAMFFDERRIVIDERLDPEENPSWKAAIASRWRTRAAGIGGRTVALLAEVVAPANARELEAAIQIDYQSQSFPGVSPTDRQDELMWSGDFTGVRVDARKSIAFRSDGLARTVSRVTVLVDPIGLSGTRATAWETKDD
jgi:hypothetical protein